MMKYRYRHEIVIMTICIVLVATIISYSQQPTNTSTTSIQLRTLNDEIAFTRCAKDSAIMRAQVEVDADNIKALQDEISRQATEIEALKKQVSQ